MSNTKLIDIAKKILVVLVLILCIIFIYNFISGLVTKNFERKLGNEGFQLLYGSRYEQVINGDSYSDYLYYEGDNKSETYTLDLDNDSYSYIKANRIGSISNEISVLYDGENTISSSYSYSNLDNNENDIFIIGIYTIKNNNFNCEVVNGSDNNDYCGELLENSLNVLNSYKDLMRGQIKFLIKR